ncbi:MAG TPA: SDR family NAD(P)-dependent oxidoreductase [Baekduia sp.]|uniref:SDR family NAD(P)-dependent oxidoreductase n=1 Tax=Baekduia sp. TaxID=2600305 RepID=UPI002D7729D4|nr:SDR family NAD(P)-dependent oxidoreductase [Baekduia sp.]HET6507041.1 SDR family NAD(P)-dependent oxidoreductase [Baekduia sp.]
MADGRMAGKVAIVTGAASGIGRATALLLASEGARVVCVDLERGPADDVVDAIAAAGGTAIAVAADVTVEADMERMAQAALDAYGQIDVLHANAGIPGVGQAHEETPAGWARLIDVNLTGVWLSSRAVLPAMLARGQGALVLTASVGGIKGVRALAGYSAAKAGVLGLMRSMAVDYAAQGIRVNAICPGTAWTPLVEATYELGGGTGVGPDGAKVSMEEARERSTARYPIGRLGTVEEIAQAVLHLAGDGSSWTTGTALVVDGGFSL